MILPKATLFPTALLPLYIFEPRYRQMLVDCLHTHRMFSVPMQKPGSVSEVPMPIAGLGLIRAAVSHPDGTSHVVLQGLARVQLETTVRYKPYRVHRIRLLEPPPCNSVRVDALVAKVRELLEERTRLGLPFPFPAMSPAQSGAAGVQPSCSTKEILGYLDSISDPEQAADLVSCAVLPGATQRQTILETIDVEARLGHLIAFLLAEIHNKTKRVRYE
jgi:ATP-dependent Lon protease